MNAVVKGNLKSKTSWLALGVGTLGTVVTLMPNVASNLGEYYGPMFMGLSVLSFVLRQVTTKPIGAK